MKSLSRKFFQYVMPQTKEDRLFVLILIVVIAIGVISYKIRYPETKPGDVISIPIVVGALLLIYHGNRKKNPHPT